MSEKVKLIEALEDSKLPEFNLYRRFTINDLWEFYEAATLEVHCVDTIQELRESTIKSFLKLYKKKEYKSYKNTKARNSELLV